jgi:hypothetical protein
MEWEKFEEIHELSGRLDKDSVNSFLQQAEEIFDTARAAGSEPCEWAILIGVDGAIRMQPAEGWELEPLRQHCGARAAYRVSRRSGGVRVEARRAGESCLLQSRPADAVRVILQDNPQYLRIQ